MSGTAGDRKAFTNVQLAHRKQPIIGAWERVLADIARANAEMAEATAWFRQWRERRSATLRRVAEQPCAVTSGGQLHKMGPRPEISR